MITVVPELLGPAFWEALRRCSPGVNLLAPRSLLAREVEGWGGWPGLPAFLPSGETCPRAGLQTACLC